MEQIKPFFEEFKHVIKTCLWHKYARIQGRASRSEFWLFMLFLVVLNLTLGAVLSAIYIFAFIVSVILPPAGIIVSIIFIITLFAACLGLFIPVLCVTARRLHDRNMSALWLFLLLIPSLGFIILLVLCALEGTKGPNRFGEDPFFVKGKRFNSFESDSDDIFKKINTKDSNSGADNKESKDSDFSTKN